MEKSKSYLAKMTFPDNFAAELHTDFKFPTLKEDANTHEHIKNQRKGMLRTQDIAGVSTVHMSQPQIF